MEEGIDKQMHVYLSVELCYAVADPVAVMVHLEHAHLTPATMVETRRLYFFADLALLDRSGSGLA